MSKNVFMKLLICSIFAAILLSSFYVPKTYALGDIFSDGKAFLSEGDSIKNTLNTTELEKTSDTIYNTLLAIGIMVAIIVAMVLGIQFMVASADEKAKVKEALLPFVVGCVVVFGAFTIWKMVVNIGNNAENSIEVTSTSDTSGSDTSTTYTKKDGKLYCDNCGDELSNIEQRRAKCSQCEFGIKGI